MIRIYRTHDKFILTHEGRWHSSSDFSFDTLFKKDDPEGWLMERIGDWLTVDEEAPIAKMELCPPMENQEIWAAGVTYLRSREARMEESQKSGGDTFYDLVYEAERPEIFFKGTASRTVGHRQKVAIRSDSHWNVPEPEAALALNTAGKVFGYTIGNDMSSRDIEGANPLYLPQAKVYRKCCALGPGLTIMKSLDRDTAIELIIERQKETIFDGKTSLARLKRTFDELAAFLFRDNVFPCGAYLLTGAGIVPGSGFTLQSGDDISIRIDGLGTLQNSVE